MTSGSSGETRRPATRVTGGVLKDVQVAAHASRVPSDQHRAFLLPLLLPLHSFWKGASIQHEEIYQTVVLGGCWSLCHL